MKRGVLQAVVPQSRGEARDEAERVKEAIRGALRTVKSRVRLSGDVSDMVRDFVRGRQASYETALACVAAVLPQLNMEARVAFLQDFALRLCEAPLVVLSGSVTQAWLDESDAQTEADKAQVRGLLALQTGNPHDLENAEIKSLAHSFTAAHLALKFRAVRERGRQTSTAVLRVVRA